MRTTRPEQTVDHGSKVNGDESSQATGTQAVDRALKILMYVAREGGARGITLMDISRHFGIHKSTVHRLLSTLLRHDFVKQDPETERYRLGPCGLELGGLYLASVEIRRDAAPYLNQLMVGVGETVHMGVLEDGEIIYIDKVESQKGIHLYSRIGARRPVHACGLGKAILAYCTDDEVRHATRRGMQALTPRTITDLAHLRDALHTVRKQGYAVDDEESREGIRCVAAAVLDHQSKPVAAISVSSIVSKFTDEKLPEIGSLVKRTAEEISHNLYRNSLPG